MIVFLDAGFRARLRGPDHFTEIVSMSGEVFRSAPGRRTLRVRLDGESYFIKVHTGVGWREIAKNLLQLKLPVLGAENEWRGIQFLNRLGVETMRLAAYGARGLNPARRESFVVTKDLGATESLEDFCRDWAAKPPPPKLKRAIIERVARIARLMHQNGANHRDLYICHFLLDLSGGRARLESENFRLYVIDLHRLQIRRRTPRRWLTKDIAGLYFSSMDIGLTRRDCFRFMKHYLARPLAETLREDAALWRAIERRAWRLYRKIHKRPPAHPPFPLTRRTATGGAPR